MPSALSGEAHSGGRVARSNASVDAWIFDFLVLIAHVVLDFRAAARLHARPERSRLLRELSFKRDEIALDEFR